jgi:hypothetical protein
MEFFMKKLNAIMVLFLLVFAIGCGGKKEDEKLDIFDIKDVVEKGEEISKNLENAEAKLEDRIKSGDTIAVDWQRLNAAIPDILGYTRSEPQGSRMTFDNQSYSTATANFKNGNVEIEVTLFDYNCATSLLAAVSTWRTLGLSVESSDGLQKVTKFDGIRDSWMFEEYNKPSKRATLTISMNDRYWLQVAANEQENTNLVKTIASNVARTGKELFNK